MARWYLSRLALCAVRQPTGTSEDEKDALHQSQLEVKVLESEVTELKARVTKAESELAKAPSMNELESTRTEVRGLGVNFSAGRSRTSTPWPANTACAPCCLMDMM